MMIATATGIGTGASRRIKTKPTFLTFESHTIASDESRDRMQNLLLYQMNTEATTMYYYYYYYYVVVARVKLKIRVCARLL